MEDFIQAANADFLKSQQVSESQMANTQLSKYKRDARNFSKWQKNLNLNNARLMRSHEKEKHALKKENQMLQAELDEINEKLMLTEVKINYKKDKAIRNLTAINISLSKSIEEELSFKSKLESELCSAKNLIQEFETSMNI